MQFTCYSHLIPHAVPIPADAAFAPFEAFNHPGWLFELKYDGLKHRSNDPIQVQHGYRPQTMKGDLTWNLNGSLQKLVITDPINPTNAQTCNYGHDDLARIASANCGAPWAQTFAFAPFGNLSKSGSASFLPTYGPTTNRFTVIPGGTPTYDTNGNLTYDVGHTYTWDAEGNALSVDATAVTMVYDAFNRMAEQTRGAARTQILYSPQSGKLALMHGQTLVKAFVRLPSGAKAVYTASGLAYYRHADHLGSSRLSTTPSRTKYYDVAYGPYGEDYGGSGTTDLSFTGQHQDTVSGGWSPGLYDFLFREYQSDRPRRELRSSGVRCRTATALSDGVKSSTTQPSAVPLQGDGPLCN